MTLNEAISFLNNLSLDDNVLRGHIVNNNKYVAQLKNSDMFSRCYEKCLTSGFFGDDPQDSTVDLDKCDIYFSSPEIMYSVFLHADFLADEYILTIMDKNNPDSVRLDEEEENE